MRIAVFADKFSGTLTSDEVIGEIKRYLNITILNHHSFQLQMVVRAQQKYLKNMVLKLNR